MNSVAATCCFCYNGLLRKWYCFHPSKFILTSRLFRSDLQKPGPNTETSRYPSDRSYRSGGSAETHTGSGSQRGDDDAQPQWNHPKCESNLILLQNLWFLSHFDWWICSSHPDDSSECGLHPDLQGLCGQPGGVCGHEYQGIAHFMYSRQFSFVLEKIRNHSGQPSYYYYYYSCFATITSNSFGCIFLITCLTFGLPQGMYTLMARCEELDRSMQPIHTLAAQIRDIKRTLEFLEALCKWRSLLWTSIQQHTASRKWLQRTRMSSSEHFCTGGAHTHTHAHSHSYTASKA